MRIVVVSTTFPSKEEANAVIAQLLEKRFVVCANSVPIKSMYFWKGTINNEEEVLIQFKTNFRKADLVMQELETLHPYEIPYIEKIEVEVTTAYAQWLNKQLLI